MVSGSGAIEEEQSGGGAEANRLPPVSFVKAPFTLPGRPHAYGPGGSPHSVSQGSALPFPTSPSPTFAPDLPFDAHACCESCLGARRRRRAPVESAPSPTVRGPLQ